jgi:NAD(P)-dependent dehydrogenase (short-subunit alcohol dehydrogenase family)
MVSTGMDIDGKVAVVTGGGSGIGRALGRAFAEAGAHVVVGDLDAAGAEDTAAGIRATGGAAVALQADAGALAGIDSLLNLASDEFGPVDLYVANAGIIGAPDLGGEDEWDRILQVNLRAHIRAAKLLVPDWQARGGGYFVSVASAAGLLSQLGAAGYAVSKHAAVGFAEWLAITYGDEGIGVSCVCPLGVDTPLLDAVRSADGAAARLSAESILQSGDVIGPDEVAAATVEAVRSGRFMVLPHPQVLDMYRRKGADYDGWIAGMRRYQRSLG